MKFRIIELESELVFICYEEEERTTISKSDFDRKSKRNPNCAKSKNIIKRGNQNKIRKQKTNKFNSGR